MSRSRRLLLFLGIFSILLVAMVAVSAAAVQADLLRVRGHVVLGVAAVGPLAAYLLLSLRYIVRVKG
jgi:hypothetical protein